MPKDQTQRPMKFKNEAIMNTNSIAVKTHKHHNDNASANTLPVMRHAIELVNRTHKRRAEVEKFVYDSYQRNFGARLTEYFPLILCIYSSDDKRLISAVGLRYAHKQKLFSECYLQESIEQTIATMQNELTSRCKIVELGNFAVRDRQDLHFVMPILGKFIKTLKVDWAIYTLTRPIKYYFNKLGVQLDFITAADISAVNGAAQNWGRYYHFKPAVYCSSIAQNLV